MSNHGNKSGSTGFGGSRQGEDRRPTAVSIDTSQIKLKSEEGQHLPANLFDDVAKRVAQEISGGKNNQKNKHSQIRQFYDELVMWEERVQRDEGRFPEFLPFIRMLNAKAAYAAGRNHVDENFVEFLHHCLDQVDSAQVLRNFKLFFEAFMGFYKAERPAG